MRRPLGLTLAVALTLLAACSSADTPNDTRPRANQGHSASRPSDSSSGADVTSNVPEVTDPIDTTAFEHAPCTVLTYTQLEELAISSEPEPSSQGLGPGCEWGDIFDDGITIEGAFITAGSSVAGLYRSHELGRYDYFKPVTIGGYPAAFSAPFDGRDKGGCSIAVGVQNKLLYSIGIDLSSNRPNYSDPCSVLKRVAEMAVETMTQGDS